MQALITVLFVCGASGTLVVQTRLGEVRGTPGEDGSAMFLGVPYALVDEENPFAAPIPHPGYNAPFEAYNDDIVCPQPGGWVSVEPFGILQCLVLNVYVPEVENASLLPVMVWFYGGAFVSGDANRDLFNPKFLLRHDVIFVAVNYRIGMYGYMCTDSAKSPGNNGLKDQLLALRWVRDNIEEFGGDRNKVTLFGESAGGMAAHLHLLSHHEKLFERVIIQSGSASSPFTLTDVDNSIPIQVARELGFDTADLDDAIDFLSNSNVLDVVKAADDLLILTADSNTEPRTRPCIEKEFEGIERFVTTHPNVAHSIKAKDTDVLIGYNNQEMIFQYAPAPDEFFYNYSFKNVLNSGFNTTDFEDMIDNIRHFYIGDEKTNPDLEENITSFASDFFWNYPAERAVELLLEDEVRVVYKYMFSYEGNRNFMRTMTAATIPGASHADELGYLFDMAMLRAQEMTEDDRLTIDRMTTLWTNFAKYGNPLPEPTALLPVSWSTVTHTSKPYLNIDRTLSTSHRTFNDRMAFWDVFYSANLHRAIGFNDLAETRVGKGRQ